VQRLNDDDEELSPQVARALRKARHPASVDVLVSRLEQDDRETQTESARALGEIGDRRAVGPLRQLFKKSADAKVVSASGEALARLNVFEAVYDLLPRMRASTRPTLRRSLAVALGDLMGRKDQFYSIMIKELNDCGTMTGKLQRRIRNYIKMITEDVNEREALHVRVQAACDAYEQYDLARAAACLHALVLDLARLVADDPEMQQGRQVAAKIMKQSPKLGVGYWFISDLAFWAETDISRINEVDILLGLYVLSELAG
jgi:HEAT repeat protein